MTRSLGNPGKLTADDYCPICILITCRRVAIWPPLWIALNLNGEIYKFAGFALRKLVGVVIMWDLGFGWDRDVKILCSVKWMKYERKNYEGDEIIRINDMENETRS